VQQEMRWLIKRAAMILAVLLVLMLPLALVWGCNSTGSNGTPDTGTPDTGTPGTGTPDTGTPGTDTPGTGDSGSATTPQYRTITPSAAKELMDSGQSFVLVDVRTQTEFDSGHIAGAILIPSTEIASRAASELPDKNQTILVYCRSGNRSSAAAHTLVDMGYTNVFDLGGILDWPYGTVQ